MLFLPLTTVAPAKPGPGDGAGGSPWLEKTSSQHEVESRPHSRNAQCSFRESQGQACGPRVHRTCYHDVSGQRAMAATWEGALSENGTKSFCLKHPFPLSVFNSVTIDPNCREHGGQREKGRKGASEGRIASTYFFPSLVCF